MTFKYGPNGPIGLLEGKTAYVIITSGGTEIGSDIDFVSGWVKHFLGFIGISDATIIPADRLGRGGDEKLAQIREMFAAASKPAKSKRRRRQAALNQISREGAMGQLVDGVWRKENLIESSASGQFKRKAAAFRNW